MDSGPSLRRVPPGDLDAVESDPVLAEQIRAEIGATGPITFARFMELALYEPGHGYYRSPDARPGRDGDFLTAPEAHPIFGRSVGRFATDVWRALGRPPAFTVREHGAGVGALAEALLVGLAADEPALANAIGYRPVEVEPQRLEALRRRLSAAGVGDRIVDDDGRPIVGLVVGNEVLDALPTHRVVQRGGELRELHVAWDGTRFVDVEGDPSEPAIAARLAAEGVNLADGQRTEVCLAVDAWVASAAAGLERGALLLVDYGHAPSQLYDPVRRRDGTLMAYLRHQAHDDPYRAIGRQDLTAHVDILAVENAARRAGLDHLGTTTQGAFLAGLGAGELLVELQSGPGSNLGAYLEARAALVRMIDPAAMGGFRVMVFGRGLADGVPLRGLEPHQTPPDRTAPY